MKTLIAITLLMLTMAVPSASATFSILQSPPYVRDAAAIVIEGTIESGDFNRFTAYAAQVPQGVVMLNSRGGVVDEGLKIAGEIRRRGYTTWVSRNSVCASVCPLIWLSGVHAAIQRNAGLGFHQASICDGANCTPSPEGNQIIIQHLRSLGLTPQQIRYMTYAAPQSLQVATEADARMLGFQVQFIWCGGLIGRLGCNWHTCVSRYCLVAP
jgi:hypothetical protein